MEKGKIAEAYMCLFSVGKSLIELNLLGFFYWTVNNIGLKIMCGPPYFFSSRMPLHTSLQTEIDRVRTVTKLFASYKHLLTSLISIIAKWR